MSPSSTARPCAAAAGLPLGLARAVQGAGGRAPGGHRRPVGRHPVDPTPGGRRAAPGRRGRRPRLPADLRHRRPARGRRRAGSPAGAACPASTPTACCRRSAPRSSSPGCRRCSASAPGDVVGVPARRLPDLRRRRAARGCDPGVVAQRSPRSARSPRRRRRNCCGSTVPATPTARCSASSTSRKVVAWARSTASSSRQRRVLRRARLARGPVAPTTPSILDPRVSGGSHEGLLAVYSAVQAVQPRGLPRGVRRRRPGVVAPTSRGAQARRHDRARGRSSSAVAAALRDDAHVPTQRAAYAGAARRCWPPSTASGFASTTPRPGSTSGPPARRTAGQRSRGSPSAGILVAPGRVLRRGRRASTCGSRSRRPTSASRPPAAGLTAGAPAPSGRIPGSVVRGAGLFSPWHRTLG